MLFEGEKEEQVCTEYIDLFFKHMVMMPELRGFEVVEKFLELSDRKDFLKYLNTWFKSNKNLEIEEMIHKSGSANIRISSELVTFCKNSTVFAKHDRDALDEYTEGLNA